MTKNGFIGFYSKTPLEDIRAENNQVYAVLDAATHRIAFAVLLKGFHFHQRTDAGHISMKTMWKAINTRKQHFQVPVPEIWI